MCMRYVNTNVQCFDSISKSLLGHIGFSSLLNAVKAKEVCEQVLVETFNIVTFINIRGSKNGDNPDNPIDAKSKLEFCVRLTKLDKDPEKQLSYDIDKFCIDLSDETQLKKSCFYYSERIEITEVKDLVLNSKGNYVVKILVKQQNDEKYQVQMTHPLLVE